GIELIDAMMIGVTTLDNKNILGIGPLDFYVEQQEQETIKFKESLKEAARAIYGDTIDTEDDPLNLLVKFLHGNGTSPSPESQPRGPLGKNVMFAASFATSIFGGTDSALLLAAAEVKLNPAKMVWHKFRVQLTKVHAPVNFCTPSTTASVLSNFRMSASLS